MSLIHVRRRRKKNWIDVKRGPSLKWLVFLAVVVIGVMWYLDVRF